MFCTGRQKKEAVFITVADSVGTQHSLPGSMICRKGTLKSPRASRMSVFSTVACRARKSLQNLFLPLQSWSLGNVGAGDGDEFGFLKRQAQAHQLAIDAVRPTVQSCHDAVLDGKGDASVISLCLWAAVPEEGVAGTNLLQLALFREAGSLRDSALPYPEDV
nr:unnamed protein product [Spirometra erinaceieuropaei]